ncbi:arginine--tRNA ligase [Marinobacterium arenosum]|uniref:arginine--tRNA ligase n=1 Tax=Marinobacterium arenosum TaxID=2862496 RepID=UPI001C96DD17|nr:arginine--tRNA ligase [Marinobacterium arenosum]MBY4678183.1 arginine--tRNA ligase [Marinobacterium arenosum]
MKIRELLSNRVQEAMIAAGVPDSCSPMVSPSNRPQFGDYQANGSMAAAKQVGTNPRELAQRIVDQLQLEDIASKVEIAGPGFINIHLSPTWLAQLVEHALRQPRMGLNAVQNPQTVVIDYSSPNLAKEMHVGHLRSTIIGDALARLLEFQGHKVIRQNHVGDWGTQFGMLIAHLEDQTAANQLAEVALADLETFYRAAKQRFDDDTAFAERARDYVVKLQSGDARCLSLWQQFIDISVAHSEEIYQLLNVTLTRRDIRAESAYNDDLPGIIEALQQQGLVQEDQGAQVAFLQELADKEGNPLPMIVQKSGGGYLYSTTDLAAVRYRNHQLFADRILYFIDARQSLHMKQVFTLSRKAGFAKPECSLEHHPFGTMMGEDGKPFKTRAGGTVKLAELLEEAVSRADQLLASKGTELTDDARRQVARKIGIGAVKYADLAKTRTNDYVFNWESMLSFEGNTAPYLQYAYTRIQSIFRKVDQPVDADAPIELAEPQEQALGLKLLQLEEVIDQVAREAYPHLLCNYLYELASLFMKFYEHCPILRSDVPAASRASRLRLCQATADTLATGLDLLGIEVMERM